jgi:hypothetical protein
VPRPIAALLLVAGVLLVVATVLPWLVLGPTSTSLWGLGETLAAVFTAIGVAAALTAISALAGRTPPAAVGVAGALVCGVALAAPLDAGILGTGAGAAPSSPSSPPRSARRSP